jgi:hypothetical protein
MRDNNTTHIMSPARKVSKRGRERIDEAEETLRAKAVTIDAQLRKLVESVPKLPRHRKPAKIILNIPIEVHFRPRHGSYGLRANERGSKLFAHFDAGVANRDRSYDPAGYLNPPAEEDPWEARCDLFYGDFGTGPNVGVFTFLYGQFGSHPGEDLQCDKTKYQGPVSVWLGFEDDFREWRELLRAALTAPVEQWPSLAEQFSQRKVDILQTPFPIQIEWQDGQPRGVVELRSALGAVIASIQIDKLRGLEFRYCARPDCRKVFQLEGRRDRIYCSMDCGHYMAVKNSRKRLATQNRSR